MIRLLGLMGKKKPPINKHTVLIANAGMLGKAQVSLSVFFAKAAQANEVFTKRFYKIRLKDMSKIGFKTGSSEVLVKLCGMPCLKEKTK